MARRPHAAALTPAAGPREHQTTQRARDGHLPAAGRRRTWQSFVFGERHSLLSTHPSSLPYPVPLYLSTSAHSVEPMLASTAAWAAQRGDGIGAGIARRNGLGKCPSEA